MTNRRQHTIPQFYLRQFLNPGYVYKIGSNNPMFVNKPTNVALKQDYYGKNTRTKKTIDNSINKEIEDKGAPAYQKLITDPSTITWCDWLNLSYLFANLFIRNPKIIEETRTMELDMTASLNTMAHQMIDSVIEATLDDRDLSGLPFKIDNDTPTITLNELNSHAKKLASKGGHRFALADIFGSLLIPIAEAIQNMGFRILEAPPDHFFITSDVPLFIQSRTTGSNVGAGWLNPDVFGSIALSPKYFLLMFYAEPSNKIIRMATTSEVRGLNMEIMRFVDKEIYSSLEHTEANEWMKKNHNAS